jgi:hypothetical protein
VLVRELYPDPQAAPTATRRIARAALEIRLSASAANLRMHATRVRHASNSLSPCWAAQLYPKRSVGTNDPSEPQGTSRPAIRVTHSDTC